MFKAYVLNAIRAFVGNWGYEVRKEPSLIAFLDARDIDLAVDVGANEGQFASQLRQAGYRGSILSFEPVGVAFARLQSRAEGDPRWHVLRHAVGERPGTATINVAKASIYSSLLEGSEQGRRHDGNLAPVACEEVAMTRLDDVAQLASARRIFLKVDTQGYERQVLAGAGRTLERTVALQLELPLAHLYEGVWQFHEAIACLDALGFVPAQFRTVAVSRHIPACAAEVDCLFRRRDENWDDH